jgi:hypothetical protein
MAMQELESQYQAKSDEELLRLEVELEQLTPEAQVRLHTELAKRGISKARREDFPAEKNQTRTGTTEGPKITLLFPSLRRLAETLRDWKRYKGQTGEWPALSIIAYAVHGIMLFGCAAFLVWFGFRRNWSGTRFLVIVLLLALPEVILWDWVQKSIRLREIRKHRKNSWPRAGVRYRQTP